MKIEIEIEHEDDGRWIGAIPSLPGVLAYGSSRQDAVQAVQRLAMKVLADRIEHDEAISEAFPDMFAVKS